MAATHRLPLAIFLLLTGCYLLTMSGHTYSTDEETMLAVTRALLHDGSVAVSAENGAPLAALRPGREGGRYSPYGVLPSLLALPLHALGAVAGQAGPAASDYVTRFAVTALNGPLTAASAALLAAWALRLLNEERPDPRTAPPSAPSRASARWAFGLALLYGLCTFAWPYARTFFSEPLASLLLLLAAERGHAASRTAGPAATRRALFISGLACGLLLTTRIAAGVAVPVIGLYVLWVIWQQRPEQDAGRSIGYVLRATFAWGLGLLPGLGVLAWYNIARFGTPLASGYASEGALFTTPLAVGLYGLLLSPGKSVLLFAPPLLLALPGAARLWRRGERALVLLAAGLFLSHLLLYARWSVWDGGGVWGPRFLLPVVAPVLLLAAGIAPQLRDEHSPAAATGRRTLSALGAAALLLGVLGFAGNLGGVLLNFGTYVVAPEPADKLYSPAGSPLVGHWRTLGERWANRIASPPVCRLGDGLYPSEDATGAPLPRRTGARGELRCLLPAGGRVSFALDDRRPPAAPPSELQLLLDGRELAAVGGQLRSYSLLLPPGEAQLTIAVRTWNPVAVGFSERDDELGPQLGAFAGETATGPVALADTSVAPLPARARPRWAWYYDPPNQHLADHWAWYLPRSELAGAGAWALGGLVVLLGAGCLAAGGWLLRPWDRAAQQT